MIMFVNARSTGIVNTKGCAVGSRAIVQGVVGLSDIR